MNLYLQIKLVSPIPGCQSLSLPDSLSWRSSPVRKRRINYESIEFCVHDNPIRCFVGEKRCRALLRYKIIITTEMRITCVMLHWSRCLTRDLSRYVMRDKPFYSSNIPRTVSAPFWETKNSFRIFPFGDFLFCWLFLSCFASFFSFISSSLYWHWIGFHVTTLSAKLLPVLSNTCYMEMHRAPNVLA